ncbi:MAG: carboxy terminal-processing peptidase [Chlamydiales bacterium]
MLKKYLSLIFLCSGILGFFSCEAKLPDVNQKDVKTKLEEIMKVHASHKTLTPQIVKRALSNYLEELDPVKTYFIESDIEEYISPDQSLIAKVLDEHEQAEFTVFQKIFYEMQDAILRRREIEKCIDMASLPSKVNPQEFKKMEWAKNEQELLTRLMRIKSLQIETARKLNDQLEDKILERIDKRQQKNEEELLTDDPIKAQQLIYSKVLKAYASALDSHTAYFTPDEASQFLINVQQRLFGIGAQLRDDINGFTVVRIVEGGPAYREKNLKVKDRIIAVNGEPVVGMDILDAVELIRGEENTPVKLTLIREKEEEDEVKEETIDITINRGEVVLKETRFESSYEPYGDGVIAYLRLHTFYQDSESSSAKDLSRELNEIKKEHKILGVILDLRNNSGGMLTQAVAVTGLFITKGIVVSIKDNEGNIQHLRDVDSNVLWDGPLIVLINKASASASEIVAQTLQDYGRAIIVGDERSYGKGSFQTFTLNSSGKSSVNPKGEYKVTRGCYYTVSGKTPQLTGVESDIIVPGAFSESELGERYAKYPLENDTIKPNFDDDLSDIPFFQRQKVEKLYKFGIQKKLDIYPAYLETLGNNSLKRIQDNINYQNFLKELKKKDKDIEEDDENQFGQNDLQLIESYNIMKDLILLMMMNDQVEETLEPLKTYAY